MSVKSNAQINKKKSAKRATFGNYLTNYLLIRFPLSTYSSRLAVFMLDNRRKKMLTVFSEIPTAGSSARESDITTRPKLI